MNISLNELVSAIKGDSTTTRHPLCGKSVLAVSTNGFVHTGVLDQEGPYLYLREAKNVRYWVNRDGGLPELANNGFLLDDKIDDCHSFVWLSSLVFMMERNA